MTFNIIFGKEKIKRIVYEKSGGMKKT